MRLWPHRIGGLVVALSLSATSVARAGAPDARPDATEGPRDAKDGAHATPDEGATRIRLPKEPADRAKLESTADARDYVTRRYEPAGFPLLAGDSDIGFEFGAVGTLSYFADGVVPYRWNMDLVAALSVKSDAGRTEIVQQSFLWQFDLPGLLGGRMRLNPEVSYQHTINYGYFGLGNASSAVTPADATNPGRYHQWIESIAQARSSMRYVLKKPLYALFAAQYLYVSPTAYEGSVLAHDATATATSGGPLIYGTEAVSLPSLAGGLVYDSRDDEIFPRSGMHHELGARYEVGIPVDSNIRYVEAGGIFRGYVPIGRFVLAGRLVTNFQMGHVPFYELFQAGPFDQKEMPGGSAGIRGVPVGRYLGPIKVIGNVELRTMFGGFTVLRQKFTIGGTTFFDTGRVFSDYSFHSPLDGTGVGLKYGIGGGLYVLWGQAALLRFEAAYSPDAVSENASLPVGIYVNDGVMF